MDLLIYQCQEFYLKGSDAYLNSIKEYIDDTNRKANIFERSGLIDYESKGDTLTLFNHLKGRRPLYYTVSILEKENDTLLFYKSLHVDSLFFFVMLLICVVSARMNGWGTLPGSLLLIATIAVIFAVIAIIDLNKILKIVKTGNLKFIKKYKSKIEMKFFE